MAEMSCKNSQPITRLATRHVTSLPINDTEFKVSICYAP